MVDLNVGPIDHTERKYKGLLEDLQGNILKSHGRNHAAHIFLTFKRNNQIAVRHAIKRNIGPKITSAAKQFTDTELWRTKGIDGGLFGNFMLSAQGYRRIGKPAVVANSDAAFTKGLKKRGPDKLLDPSVDQWEETYRRDLHALVILADDDQERVRDALKVLIDELETANVLESHHTEWGNVIRDDADEPIEHFGYRDGMSQPLFLKEHVKDARTQGTDKFDPGAFLKNVLVRDSNVDQDHSHGSYFVFRKLEQNVRAFREDEKRLAQILGVSSDLAGAYAVGRFRDGTPVVLSDKAGGRVPSLNNFNFEDDPDGNRCPLHAHVRKVNPRGAVLLSQSRRIARRAIPYGGGPFVDPGSYPSTGAGLLFMAFMSKIGGTFRKIELQTQFEFMQDFWANNRDFPTNGVGIDPIIGQGKAGDSPRNWPTVWGKKTSNIQGIDFSRYVTMKGGEYFFAPSISFVARL